MTSQFWTRETIARCLGLLDTSPIEAPDQRTLDQYPYIQYEFHNFTKTTWQGLNAVKLECACGRAKPLWVPCCPRHRFISTTNRTIACPICLDEEFEATTLSQQIKAAINRRRATFLPDKDAHVHISKVPTLCTIKGESERPRRFVYQTFYGMELDQTDKVLSKCKEEGCMNPLHMYVSRSCAKKLYPEAEKELHAWFRYKFSTTLIERALYERFGVELSPRTIQRKRVEWLQSQQP